MIRLLLVLSLAAASNVWAAATEPKPHVKSPAELAWEAVPDTLPDAEQVQVAREYLDKYPTEIPLLRSVQNILNRKSDLTIDFWIERMNSSPTTANRYLYARKSSDSTVMKAQADWIIENDPENFWGYYLAATAEWNKEVSDMAFVTGMFEKALEKDPSRPEGWGYGADAYEQVKDWDNALRMYQSAMVVEPDAKHYETSIMGIYAQKRDADMYFQMLAKRLPKDPPLQTDLGIHGSTNKFSPATLAGNYTVLEFFTYW